jgi:mono/diheme cytochrome c family protein
MRAGLMAALAPLALLWGEPCNERKPVEAAGRDLYAIHCAACHGMDATGRGPRAESLATDPADLTLLRQRYGTPLPVDTLSNFIDGRDDTHAGREMPAFGETFFTDKPSHLEYERNKRIAIALILDHLETLQPPPAVD